MVLKIHYSSSIFGFVKWKKTQQFNRVGLLAVNNY